MRPISRGHLTLPTDSVRLDRWGLALQDGPMLGDPDQLPDWTQYQSTRVSITLTSNPAEVRAAVGLDEPATIGSVLLWSCSGTGLRGSSAIVPFDQSEVTIDLDLDGGLLRGDLALQCLVVLTHAGQENHSPFSPTEPGSVLWSQETTVRLEGIGARMPIEVIPFSKLIGAAGKTALWRVVIDSRDLNAPVDAVARIQLNQESPIIQELLVQPDSDSAKRTFEFLHLDVSRNFVREAINPHLDFDPGADYDRGSLGLALAAPVTRMSDDLADLRRRFEEDPSRVEAEIQGNLGGLR